MRREFILCKKKGDKRKEAKENYKEKNSILSGGGKEYIPL